MLEQIAGEFLSPTNLVHFQRVVLLMVTKDWSKAQAGRQWLHAMAGWIRREAHPSGITSNTFFLSLSGISVRLRVDIDPTPDSPAILFRAISR